MPKLELGDLQSVARLKDKNLPPLLALAREGYAILTPVPSCTLMFKQELPLMFPEDAALKQVADAMFDPFEYLSLRHRTGCSRPISNRSSAHRPTTCPCHLRVQNMGLRTQEMLNLVPGTQVNTVERCSGHDGTWGVKTEYFAQSMKIGRPVFKAMAAAHLAT
jgi:Fe-S oxidoreductase